MSCTLDAPCGNAKRLVVVMPTHAVYQCLNGHTMIVGELPKWASKYHQAQAESEAKRCGHEGCRKAVGPDHARCILHRGKGRGVRQPGKERKCAGCGVGLESLTKWYCEDCDAREKEARARDKELKRKTGAKYLCLECDSPNHRTPACPIEKASRV